MESNIRSLPREPYDLRVGSYYPQKCDHLIPFTGVPTEELARRSVVNEKAGKGGRHRMQTSYNVRNCIDDHRNRETNCKVEWFGTRRRCPPAASHEWFGIDPRDALTIQLEEQHRSGRRQPLMRRDLMPGVLVHDNSRSTEDVEERRARKQMDLNYAFSDVHALHPVIHKNQETSDMKSKGLHRSGRTHLEGSTSDNIFTYPLPRKRLPGYNGCVEIGFAPVREFQRSSIEAFEGFIAPKDHAMESQNKPINRAGNGALAAENHLTGGAVPLSTHEDSFEGQKRQKKEPTILKHFRNLEIRNQQQYEEQGGVETAFPLGVSGHSRRRSVPRIHTSSPTDLVQFPRFKRAPDASAHADHIWDLNRSWGTDVLRIDREPQLFDDPYPWQPIDEEKELEHVILNYPSVGHDPPRMYKSTPSRSEFEKGELLKEAREMSVQVPCQENVLSQGTSPSESNPTKVDGGHRLLNCGSEVPSAEVAQCFPARETSDCGLQQDELFEVIHDETRAGIGRPSDTEVNSLHDTELKKEHRYFDSGLRSKGDLCPVSGESAEYGVEPEVPISKVPPFQFVDTLKPVKGSPQFGVSSRSSESSELEANEKIRMVSHVAVPRSRRPDTAYAHSGGTFGADTSAGAHFRTSCQRGSSQDPDQHPVGGGKITEGQTFNHSSTKYRTQSRRELHPRPSNPARPNEIYDRQATQDSLFQSIRPQRHHPTHDT